MQRQFHKKCGGEILRTEGMAKGGWDEEIKDRKHKLERLISCEVGFLKRVSKTETWIQMARCYRKTEMGDDGRQKWGEHGSYFSLLKCLFIAFQCCDNELMFWVNCCKSTPFTFSKSLFRGKFMSMSLFPHAVIKCIVKLSSSSILEIITTCIPLQEYEA